MAPCGRVRSRCPGPALLLLLALAARPVASALPAGGPAAGGNQPLAGQAVGLGAAGPRVPRGGGSGSGWKLSEEAVCREDVVRLCSKHSWANNLAVLECLQDVREVRAERRAGPGLPAAAANKERSSAPPRRRASAARAARPYLPQDFGFNERGLPAGRRRPRFPPCAPAAVVASCEVLGGGGSGVAGR